MPSASSDKLRVGAVGVGSICRQEHLPYWKSCPHAELVAVCDRDEARLQSVAAEFDVPKTYADWRNLIADESIDVVDVCAPNGLHAPVSLAALESGKHVLCEKPMAVASADAARMIETARRARRSLMINHHFRFDARIEGLRELTGGDLGEPYFARAYWRRRRRVPVGPTFLSKEIGGGGPMLDLAVHVLDLALWLMGSPEPIAVSACSYDRLSRRDDLGGDWGDWRPADYEVEDLAAGFVRLEGGGSIAFDASWLGFFETEEEWGVRALGAEAGVHWPEGRVVGERNRTPFDNLNATRHAMSSYSDESISLASQLDPRFIDDPDFPNQWQSVTRNDLGQLVLGEAVPYVAAGFYVKATRLQGEEDAIFIEYHHVFEEPEGWFRGVNLLRSKLPLIVQDRVRKFRRQLANASTAP